MRSLMIVLAACGSVGGTERVFEDVGRMCLFDSTPSGSNRQSFVVDGEVTISINLIGVCLSSTCDIERSMTCEVSGGLAVTSRARWIDQSGEMFGEGSAPCTADCGNLGATCNTAALPAGTHVVTFGGQSLTMTVPSEAAEPPCVEAD